MLKQVAAVLAGAAALAVILASLPRAHAGYSDFDCKEFAITITEIADFRDTGADVEKVVAMAMERLDRKASLAHRAAIEREIRRLWREALPAEEAGSELFKRCHAQGGDMGLEG